MDKSQPEMTKTKQTKIPIAARWFLPTIGSITFLSIIYFLLSDNNRLLDDGDTGFHIRIGDLIRETGTIPRVDPFSFTMAGHKWFAWEWLTDIFMSWIHSVSGLRGIVCVSCIIIVIVFMLLYRRMLIRNSNPFIAFFLTVFAAMTSSLHWMARPHLLSWLLLSLASMILESYRHHRTKWIYVLPFLVAIWANLHGAFIIIFPMLAIYFTGELIISINAIKYGVNRIDPSTLKTYLIIVVLSAISSLATPYGWQLHKHIWRYLNDSALLDIITEFKSPDFHTTLGILVEIIILFSIVAIVQAVKKHKWIDIGLLLLFIHLMLQSVRHIPVAAIIIFPIIANYFSELFKDYLNNIAATKNGIGQFLMNFRDLQQNCLEINSKLLGYGFYTLIIVAVFIVLSSPTGKNILDTDFNPELHPIKAAKFITTSGLKGNVFSSDEYGDYLIYKFYPKIKVFIDGRSDFYNTGSVIKDYQKLINLDPSWSEILNRYGVQWMLLKKSAPLGLIAKMSGDWELAYSDDNSQILLKKQASDSK